MSKRLRQSDQAAALLYHARSATPFCSEDGQFFASVPSSFDSRQVLPLRSAAFRDWLIANFYTEFEAAPSPDAIRSAIRTLEAQARYGEMPAQKLDLRLSFEGDHVTPSKITVDLANQSGETLEIDSHGWRIADNLSSSFRESTAMLALPRPAQSSSEAPLDALDQFATLCRFDDTNRTRVLTWLISALRPAGPYPVLVLRGPAASGKSFLARALRTLIDPSAAPLRRLPSRDREVLHLAHQNWVLAFDQVQRIPARVAGALSALSSGDAYEIPQADYRDPLVCEIARPIILVAPSDELQSAWAPPRSLSNRTLAINLERIAAPRPESALTSDFETMRPALLAALAEAVSTALQRIRGIDLGNVARLPDCAIWAAAAAPGLGIDEQSVVDAFTDPDAVWIGSNPLRDAVHSLLRSNPVWKGDASELLSQLRAIAPPAVLPASPKGVFRALDGIAGISIERPGGARSSAIIVTRTGRAREYTARW